MPRTKRMHAKPQYDSVNVKSIVAVKLTIHAWPGTATNRDAATAIEKRHKVEHGNIKAMMMLLPKAWVRKISAASSNLRRLWDQMSLPWEDGAWRVVPSASYHKTVAHADELISAYQKITDRLVREYPRLLKEAKSRLGDLYDESKYPAQSNLEGMFGAEIFQRPIVAGKDIRVDGLSDAALEEMRKSVERQMTTQINAAVMSLVERLRELVADAIRRYTKKEQKRVRYAGMQKIVKRTCDALAGMNISGDAAVQNAIDTVQDALTAIPPDDIRESPQKHAKALRRAKDVMSVLDAFGTGQE